MNKDILNYIKAMAQLKRALAINALLNNNFALNQKLKVEEEMLWVIHRNILIGDLVPLTDQIKELTHKEESE